MDRLPPELVLQIFQETIIPRKRSLDLFALSTTCRALHRVYLSNERLLVSKFAGTISPTCICFARALLLFELLPRNSSGNFGSSDVLQLLARARPPVESVEELKAVVKAFSQFQAFAYWSRSSGFPNPYIFSAFDAIVLGRVGRDIAKEVEEWLVDWKSLGILCWRERVTEFEACFEQRISEIIRECPSAGLYYTDDDLGQLRARVRFFNRATCEDLYQIATSSEYRRIHSPHLFGLTDVPEWLLASDSKWKGPDKTVAMREPQPAYRAGI